MTHPWQSVGVIVEGACRERNGKHANLPKFSVRIELLPHFPHLALRWETVGVASWHHQPMGHHMGDRGRGGGTPAPDRNNISFNVKNLSNG